jgi:tetratricopeptide (TPR) repeat protein
LKKYRQWQTISAILNVALFIFLAPLKCIPAPAAPPLADDQYQNALTAWSHGDNAKAQTLFVHTIKHFAKSDYTPSLAQIQLTYAQFLQKTGNEAEAKKLQQHYLPIAQMVEKKFRSDEADLKKAVQAADKENLDYTFKRNNLSKQRHVLAMLCLAEGKYADAETLLKAAFNDEASIYGRHAADALDIEQDYERLLGITGRKPDAAKALITLSPDVGHPSVLIDVPANDKLKKSGADKLVVVLEDQFKAATMGCWFTKGAFLQGMSNGKVIWTKPFPLRDCVNMDTTKVDSQGNYITIWFTPPDSQKSKFQQRFSWNGSALRFVDAKDIN